MAKDDGDAESYKCSEAEHLPFMGKIISRLNGINLPFGSLRALVLGWVDLNTTTQPGNN